MRYRAAENWYDTHDGLDIRKKIIKTQVGKEGVDWEAVRQDPRCTHILNRTHNPLAVVLVSVCLVELIDPDHKGDNELLQG